jgi:hypothetical protein
MFKSGKIKSLHNRGRFRGGCLLAFTFLLLPFLVRATSILIPMDEVQKDHLKSYGIAFWVLKDGGEVDWLLNYRGGSFMSTYTKKLEDECKIRGVSYEVLPEAKVSEIVTQINDPSVNMDLVKLEKAPRMAVYSPKVGIKPSDDAVIIVLKYAEIPFDIIYDDEILNGDLPKYDWIHLHHEDFTGQYSKNTGRGGRGGGGFGEDKLVLDKQVQEATAHKWGFQKVSKMKLAVAQHIRDFVAGGGFLFAMCSGADSFDIALASANTDIVDVAYDGDGVDPKAQSKLDFSQTFAFQNFIVDTDPYSRRFSDIDVGRSRYVSPTEDFFTLFDFSAKWDVVPSMLTQDHERVIKGFRGLATAFNMSKLKPGVTIMGELKSAGEARYIHGEYGKGQWTFYGGHDPEGNMGGGMRGGFGGGGPPGGGFGGAGGKPPVQEGQDLSLHPNSPGYRLILNNVLFPAAKKKHQKT